MSIVAQKKGEKKMAALIVAIIFILAMFAMIIYGEVSEIRHRRQIRK